MTKHGALSILANIKPGFKQQVIDICKQIEAEGVDTNHLIPFKQIMGLHFARFVVLNESEDADGNKFGARLIFTSNYDEPFDHHLQELIACGGKGFWQIFSYCEGFPTGTEYNEALLINYLKSAMIKSKTFYVGVGYRSVMQIKQENELRNQIENYIDKNRSSLRNQGPIAIREKIIEYVNRNPALNWTKQPVAKPSLSWKIGFYGKLVLFGLLVIVLLPLIIPFVIIWLLIILLHEVREKDISFPVDKGHIRELVERENGLGQAQFSAMGNVKPGWVRRQTMLFLLSITNFLAPYLFGRGKLSGIPTVHFARWIIINRGRQMIFLSNFDGNSESYLRDFINIAGKQLSLMFCHTIGYPKTRLMVIGGADDANGFMRWARKFQTITNVWYSANKEVSVSNIFKNSKIRDGLYGNMTEKEAAKWLSLL